MADGDLLGAARQTFDPIQHDMGWLGKVIGGIVGFVVAAVVVIALVSNPVGWVAMAAIVSTVCTVGLAGAWVGEKIGEPLGRMFYEDKGDIITGSPNVWIEERQAARATDPVKCHAGKKIAEGMRYISINDLPASRQDHKTECAGKIKEGSKTVLYAGPTIQVLPIVRVDDTPRWYTIGKEIIDWVGFVTGLPAFFAKGGFKMLSMAWKNKEGTFKILSAAYDMADTAMWLPKKIVEGKFQEVFGEGAGGDFFRKREFTDGPAYRTFDFIWGGLGLAKAGKEMYDGRAGAGGTTDAPTATDAPTTTTGGADAPTAPRSADTPTTPRDAPPPVVNREVAAPPPAPRAAPEGQFLPEAQFDGHLLRQSPDHSGLFVPARMAPGGNPIILPDQAPRIEAPPTGPIVLVGEAPRLQGQSSIINPNTGQPFPSPAPRVAAPPPEVAPNVPPAPATPSPPPDVPAPAAPPAAPPAALPGNLAEVDASLTNVKNVKDVIKQVESGENMVNAYRGPPGGGNVEPIPLPYSP